MERAVRRWYDHSEAEVDEEAFVKLVKRLSRKYTKHGSMLLIQPGVIDNAEDSLQFTENDRKALCDCIAKEMQVTHIAINKAIPPRRDDESDPENVIRAPVHFQPVHGDFGPRSSSWPPSEDDINQAYWVTAKQNGISQTWAPRWTMFSRGNISEKARILDLCSVKQTVKEGQESGRRSCAVDLYAGIGYFTFSYVKAGVSKVLCWELNSWSCEGLRKGAKANRWSIVQHVDSTAPEQLATDCAEILLFHESNELATRRIDLMRSWLPPIRHVNCGLLPTSRLSWLTAVKALDPLLGGWIHVHENFGVDEIEVRSRAVRDDLQTYLGDDARVVELESVNRVKTYAPGVFHVVLDMFVPPRGG